jgi:hypothetical protein
VLQMSRRRTGLVFQAVAFMFGCVSTMHAPVTRLLTKTPPPASAWRSLTLQVVSAGGERWGPQTYRRQRTGVDVTPLQNKRHCTWLAAVLPAWPNPSPFEAGRPPAISWVVDGVRADMLPSRDLTTQNAPLAFLRAACPQTRVPVGTLFGESL